jgi:hypothetical protein
MDALAQTLESFNRKERNLLVRAALGHKETPLRLSAKFRAKVSEKLGIGTIPEDAWWATDYHFGWLAGALAVYSGDQAALLEPGRPNPPDLTSKRRLVEGNQEDIDLVIAFGQNLILLEAKAYGAWSNGQMKSKLERLHLLCAYRDELRQASDLPIDIHLLLISVAEPQKLAKVRVPWSDSEIDLPWISLDIDEKILVRTVTRCNSQGIADAMGDRWRVV